MESEPVFGGYERDPIKPEIKSEKGLDESREKKDKKKKSRNWNDARDARDKRENKEFAVERDEKKAKRAGEGVLGLAGKENKPEKPEAGVDRPTSLAPEAIGTLVLDRPENVDVSPETSVDGSTTITESLVEMPKAGDFKLEANPASAPEPASIFERVNNVVNNGAEDDIVDAEIIEESDIEDAEPSAETRDIVDAEVIESDSTDKKVEGSAGLPAITDKTHFVYARPRVTPGGASGGSSGSGGVGGPGGGGASGGGGGTHGPGSPGGPTGQPHGGGPSSASGFNAAARFNTIPIPVPVETDPFAYQRGKRRGLAQGLLAGGVGGWLFGRRGGKKKLAAAERQHAAKTAEQNKHIKQLEFSQNHSTTAEAPPKPPVEALKPHTEAPRPALERIVKMGGVGAEVIPKPTTETVARIPAVQEAATSTNKADRPVIETMANQKLPEQAMGIEADSRVREDAHEKLDRPQDQGALTGGGAAAGPAYQAQGLQNHSQSTISQVTASDPLARSVLSARKQAQQASQKAAQKARMEIFGLVAAIAAVLSFIAFTVAR